MRLLPLEKVAGSVNAADRVTTHLIELDILKWIRTLNLEVTTGRSEKAAQLHSMLDIDDKISITGDSLDATGAKGTWRRCHSTWRRCLFTPTRVPKGPRHGGMLTGRRWTHGIRKDGSKFEIWDCWMSPSKSHQMLEFEWRGHTTSFSKADVVDIGDNEPVNGSMVQNCENHPEAIGLTIHTHTTTHNHTTAAAIVTSSRATDSGAW